MKPPAFLPPFVRVALLPFVLIAGALPQRLDAQAGGRIIPVADLQADAALLRHAYEALHPGLRRYNTTDQLEAHWAALGDEFARPRTQAEAYLAISRLTASIRCGHTYPNFYNQSDSLINVLLSGTKLVPFEFRWIDRRMIITRSVTNDVRLPRGTEVLDIDGVPVRTILDSLLTVTRADGSNDAKRIHLLEVQGVDRYETFDIYHHLFFPAGDNSFALTVRLPGATSATRLRVQPITQREREAAIAPKLAARTGTDSLWEFRYLDPKTAYLRMDTWAMYNSKWEWKPWLEARMQDVAMHASTLIIDLRRNEGGNDVGNVILAHFVSSKFTIPASKRFVRYRTVPPQLTPYLDTWDKSFRDWGAAATPADSGFLRLTRYDDSPDGDVIAPVAPQFTGRVAVLVGPENSSATFQFAQVIQQQRLGTLVGQPTGGNQRGLNGGAFFFLRLPKSGIEVDLPLIASFPPGEPPDAGLTPDMFAAEAVEDVRTGRDAALEAAQFAGFSTGRFGQRVNGEWTGSLVYRDFSSDRFVALPTALSVQTTAPSTVRFAYAWDDGPGKLLRDTATMQIDQAAGTVTVTGAGYGEAGEYRLVGATGFTAASGGTIVLAGTGTDNGAPVDVRTTYAVTTDAMTIRREIRVLGGTYGTRHEYRFARSSP